MRKILVLGLLSALLLVFVAPDMSAKRRKRDDGPAHNLPFPKKLEFANELFASGSFYNAIEFYEELRSEQPINPYVNYMLAESYHRTRNYPMAAMNYRRAYETAPEEFSDARFKMALMYKQAGDYKTARGIFMDVINDKTVKNKKLKQLAETHIQGIDLAEKSLGNQGSYYVKNAGPNINKAYTEFSPIPLGDSILVYSSIRKETEINIDQVERGDYVSKLYMSDKKKYTDVRDSFMVPYEFYGGIFNDDRYHVGNPSFSPTGTKFYFTKCRESDTFNIDCSIYVSDFSQGEWGRAYKLPETINMPNTSNTHPNVVKIGKKEVLFFSSDRPKQAQGGYDIWVSVIDAKGKYSRPQNLGKKINTIGDEVTPYYDTEKGVLYFSSDGLENMGGFDVFEALGGPTRYSEVHNMGAPINTSADDLYYATDGDGSGNAWMVSNRLGSVALKSPTCCDDIWRVWVAPEFRVKGNVYDKTTQQKLGEVAIQMSNQDGTITETSNSTTGNYDFEIPISNQFAITANKEGYMPATEYVSTLEKTVRDRGETYTRDFYLEKMPEILDIKLLYYDFDDERLRNGTHPELNEIAAFMTKYPFVKLDIISHTDELGTKAYNQKLSERRSNSVKQYLESKGVQGSRLITIGKGETEPMVKSNGGAEDRQMNRRTEFWVHGEVPGVRVVYERNQPEYIDRGKRRKRDTEVNKNIDPDGNTIDNTDGNQDSDQLDNPDQEEVIDPFN